MHDIDRTQVAYPGEMESYPIASESPALSEAEEMEYASRLMEIQSEEEFEEFIGDIVSGIGGLFNSATGNSLGGFLKGAAKKLLPIAGSAIGGYFGGPLGASLGGKIAGGVAGSLEMESDEMEWEAAKNFVRFAAEAAKNASSSPEQDPHMVAQQATVEAAQKHAPQLLEPGPMPMPGPEPFPPERPHGSCSCHHRHHHHREGQWVRHGREIVLYGV